MSDDLTPFFMCVAIAVAVGIIILSDWLDERRKR
jgi:capsular polysaccharide biosynthesis protein